MNGRYQLMIELEDENGNKLPYFFVDRKEYAKRKEVMDELDKSSVYMTGSRNMILLIRIHSNLRIQV